MKPQPVTTITELRAALPTWHFEPLGTMGTIAAYPPNPPSAAAYEQLSQHARITGGICAVGYCVNPFLLPTRPDHFA